MARVRTQKAVASRIDLNYHKKPHPWRRGRVILVTLCTLAAGAWAALSSVQYKNGKLALIDKIHNPGPMTRAHAQIEQDCRACHDGDMNADGKPDNGYWLSVSDAACLKCHDGSIHHANQKFAEAHGGADKAQFVMAVKDANHPGGAVSANCVSCHIEHRGHEALAGTSDAHCINCHENVKSTSRDGTAAVQNRVVTFAAGEHPRFGRSLLPAGASDMSAGWIDSTQIHYNHARKEHAEIPPMPGAADNCTRCHEVSNPPSLAGRSEEDLKKFPPFAAEFDRPASWVGSSDRRYIQPVSFDRHCIGCHGQGNSAAAVFLPPSPDAKAGANTLKDKLWTKSDVPHVSLDVLRGMVLARVNTMAAGPLMGESKTGTGPRAKVATTQVAPADWLAGNAAAIDEALKKKLTSLRGSETDKWLVAMVPDASPTKDDAVTPAMLADKFVALAAATSCTKCHSLTTAAAGAPPTTQPAAEFKSQDIKLVASGIPDAPRRWFPASRFDHYAHRQMNCIDCHAAAEKSSLTRDVLTADIDGQYLGAKNLNIPAAAQSCVSCHHPETKSAKGAPSNCVSCHDYHNHQFERTIDHPSKTLIAPSAAAETPASQPAGQ